MQDKTAFFIIFLLSLILIVPSHPYTYGGNCKDKAILDDSRQLIGDSYSDYKQVYNGIASCGSLKSTLNTACCYIKVKFRNTQADKKTFTHYGCIEVYDYEFNDIKTLINNYKSNITTQVIDKTKVDIDCHSKLIKLTGLILLFFIL